MELRRTKDLKEFTIAATDADIGTIHDFYFDDKTWTIRYIVVATGPVMLGRKVLISPVALRKPAWEPLHLRVNLTSSQVENSPSIDLHKPVSRQHEVECHNHYGWPYYWEITGSGEPASAQPQQKVTTPCDSHLRSTREVIGYHILAADGEIGHIEDFLFDDETWEIRYAIIDTGRWWAGRRVLLRPSWIKQIHWENRQIDVNISRETIRNSPAWDPMRPVSRDYELRLHRYYGAEPYWTTDGE